MDFFFRKTILSHFTYVHHVMGVCCIVFDIDGMLFEFCMNFLNMKKIKFSIFFFQYFMFSSCFISNIKK